MSNSLFMIKTKDVHYFPFDNYRKNKKKQKFKKI